MLCPSYHLYLGVCRRATQLKLPLLADGRATTPSLSSFVHLSREIPAKKRGEQIKLLISGNPKKIVSKFGKREIYRVPFTFIPHKHDKAHVLSTSWAWKCGAPEWPLTRGTAERLKMRISGMAAIKPAALPNALSRWMGLDWVWSPEFKVAMLRIWFFGNLWKLYAPEQNSWLKMGSRLRHIPHRSTPGGGQGQGLRNKLETTHRNFKVIVLIPWYHNCLHMDCSSWMQFKFLKSVKGLLRYAIFRFFNFANFRPSF